MRDQLQPVTVTKEPWHDLLGWIPKRHFGRRTLLVIATLTLVGLTGCATTKPPPPPPLPATVDSVVVKKSLRKLQLVSRGRIVREYPIALGGSPVGHKFREGDQRTPEGSYVLNWRNPNSNFYKAIHISYPSERDRMVSYQLGYRPGGMIMIHGMPSYVRSEALRRQYMARDWTQGCIAVQDDVMDVIWRVVRDGTPIQIRP